MSTLNAPDRLFTWRNFAIVVIGQVAIAGTFVVYWHVRDRSLTTADVGALALVVWVNLSFAVTWRNLMRQERSGELSPDEYRANRKKYLMGSKLNQRVTFWGAIVVMTLFAVVSSFL